MRLFIAVQLSEEMKTALLGTMHELKKAGVKGSYTPGANLHLTMAFIGEFKDAEAVRQAAAGVPFKPFKLSLDGLGTFDNTLWAGIKGNQGLKTLAKDLRAALNAAGIPCDPQAVIPHVTLVRRAAGRWQTVPAPKGDMMVRKLSVMRSDLKDGRRVYTELR